MGLQVTKQQYHGLLCFLNSPRFQLSCYNLIANNSPLIIRNNSRWTIFVYAYIPPQPFSERTDTMKALFIDDQPNIRGLAALSFFAGCEVEYSLTIPKTFEGYDIISFDNDLGDSSIDVITEIHQRIWEQFPDKEAVQGNQMISQLKNKQIIIHSMNPVASKNLYNTFLSAGIHSTMIPFNYMSLATKYKDTI